MKFSIRAILFGIIPLALVAMLVGRYVQFQEREDLESSRHTASMLIRGYMDANDGQWPKNWEQLRAQFDIDFSAASPHTFDGLKNILIIDFEIDINELESIANNEQRSESFEPIRLRHHENQKYVLGPNQMILERFRE